jgi:hypothetical protein
MPLFGAIADAARVGASCHCERSEAIHVSAAARPRI